MAIAPSNNYSQNAGTSTTALFIEIFKPRPPTPGDVNYTVQQRWYDTVADVEYILIGYTYTTGVKQANWQPASTLSPTVATSYVTDVNSPSIPALNVLNLLANDTNVNDVDGIRTDGSSGSNTLTVQLTNRIQGAVQTVGLVTSPIISFTPTVIGTYAIEARIAAYNTTSGLGAGYSVFGAIRYDGTNSFEVGTLDKIVNEEGAMSACQVTLNVTGTPLVTIDGTGYAGPNQTINWLGVALYTFVGV